MKRRIAALLTLSIFLLAAMPLWAHEQYRIVGTVTKFQNSKLQVKNKAGKLFTIAFDGQTIVRRDKDKVAATELKAGRSVVVDALGDSEKDLVAVEVRIVPALPGK